MTHEHTTETTKDTDTGSSLGEVDKATLARAYEDIEWEFPWQGPFLAALRAIPNVSAAARSAQIDHSRPYKVRDADPLFRAAWEDALDQSLDGLELYAIRMATTGLKVNETRTTVKSERTPGGAMQITEQTTVEINGRLVSPQMAMFLLRAYRGEKFTPTLKQQGAGSNGEVVVRHEIYRMPDPERARELARLALELGPGEEQPAEIDGEAVDADDEHAPEAA